jgi:cell division protein FtsW
MMQKQMSINRTHTGIFGRWWWTIDRFLLTAFVSLMIVSTIMVTASSPPVAKRIGLDAYHFVSRQHFFLFIGFVIMIGTSLLPHKLLRRGAIFGLLGSLILMALLPLIGAEIKGAKRWLSIGFMAVQPSEFMKPCFAIVIAWVLSERQRLVDFPAYKITAIVFAVAMLLLIIQPDIGMAITLAFIYGVQLFISGIPIIWVILCIIVAVMALVGAYFMFPHMAKRIDGFLDASSVDNYQVKKSMEAFSNGGLTGQGMGEGSVKWSIPDAHTDFIFAVIGEEFGMIIGCVTILVFLFIVLRGFARAYQSTDTFVLLAVSGLIAQFGLQAFINMGVAVHLLPAKGMTLPFLSYGGSSLFAMALMAGAILALTRRRYGNLHRNTVFTY